MKVFKKYPIPVHARNRKKNPPKYQDKSGMFKRRFQSNTGFNFAKGFPLHGELPVLFIAID
jgi:hypothetical protein